MAYTVIWFSKKAPEASKTLHVSHFMIFAILAVFVVGLPLVSFWAGYTYVAPEAMQKRLERQTLEVASAIDKKKTLQKKIDQLRDDLNHLQMENLAEINKRAEAEARISMVEAAKKSALDDLEKLKEKNQELRSQLDIFQDILQPTSETLPIQCYKVDVNQNENELTYKISLLKTDNEDTREMTINLKARILEGMNLSTLSEVDIADKDKKKQIKMAKLLSTSGKIRGEFTQNGVQVLDIRGYIDGEDDKLALHCWKAF